MTAAGDGTAAVFVPACCAVIGAAWLLLMTPYALALPADASCVYLALGCSAPSPLPQPAFPDPLFPPIPVPSTGLAAPALEPALDVGPRPLVAHRPRRRALHHRRRHTPSS